MVDAAAGSDSAEPGFGLTVIPLEFVSGTTLTKLLEGFATRPGAIRPEPSGSLLIEKAAIQQILDFGVIPRDARQHAIAQSIDPTVARPDADTVITEGHQHGDRAARRGSPLER